MKRTVSRNHRAVAYTAILALALILNACGSDTEPSSSAAGGPSPDESQASNEGGQEEAQDDAVEAAKAATQGRMAPQTEWTGPTDGPTAPAGVKVVYISSDQASASPAAWGAAQVEAGESIGWEVVVLDGKGTTSGRLSACNQALALNPDAITLEGDAAGMQDCLEVADENGIPIVAIHGAGFPGPVPDLHLFTNVTSHPTDIGIALADFIIADSDGAGKAMILYDSLFDVARAKAEGMRDQFAKCSSCELLGYESSPLAEVQTRTPELFTSYLQQHGDDFQYVMSITDFYYDFGIPALEAAGVAKDGINLVGSDGTEAAYSRIRAGEYQFATVPEPLNLQGYQVIDEVNRALAGEEPSGYAPPIYVVTQDNIDQEGGDQGQFIPSNGYKEQYLRIWQGN